MFEGIISKKEEKFNDLEKKIYKYVCMLGCMLIKMILEKQDKKIMKERDKNKYRHKGLRETSINTIMGEIKYKRAIYEVEINGEKKTVYLLDEQLQIKLEGKVSANLVEKIVETVPTTTSYRKAAEVIETTSNTSLSHEKIREIVIATGNKITQKEKEEIKAYQQEKLKAGEKETHVLFEEADGIWINLQGKDRKKRLEENKKKAEKEGKEFNERMKIKSELKLHMMYEGWEKGNDRHKLVNKEYIAGMMKPKELANLRDARVYQKYKIEKIEVRVMNGDGARWTKGITSKGGIYQKDKFHIMQEIVRDVPKEHRYKITELIENKEYGKIAETIEILKYEVGGEEKAVKKLEKLNSYLNSGLERYQDVRKIPEAPEGIEYRNLGTQESQIFSKLKVRFCSGRKAFSIEGANALSKICVLNEKFSIEEIERTIPIDTSIEDYIKAIEEKVRENKMRHYANEKEIDEGLSPIHIENQFMKEITKMVEFSEMRCNY